MQTDINEPLENHLITPATSEETGGNLPVPTPQENKSGVRGLLEKIGNTLRSVKDRFSTQAEPLDGGTISAPGISPKTKKVVTITAGLFLTVITLLVIVTYYKNMDKKPKEEPKGDSGAQTTIVERKPSRYATDEAVLKIEADVKALEESINIGSVEEKDLTPPNLNFEVNFKE